MSNKVYTAVWSKSIGAAQSLTSDVIIKETNNEIRLKSINFDLQIRDVATSLNIPLGNNVDLLYYLYVGRVGGPAKIGANFIYEVGDLPTYNGTVLAVFNVGQIIFDSFTFMNEVPLTFNIYNASANQYTVTYSLVVETEQKIIYR